MLIITRFRGIFNPIIKCVLYLFIFVRIIGGSPIKAVLNNYTMDTLIIIRNNNKSRISIPEKEKTK
jgi:hypothetical protein